MKCEYCGKDFKRESTLLAHTCEKKRRWLAKEFPETIAGFAAFDLFYRLGRFGMRYATISCQRRWDYC